MIALKENILKNCPVYDSDLGEIKLTYQLFGQPLHSAPVVLVNHALTGNSNVSGENGWWKNLVGDSKTVDLNHYTVIAFNIPGNGYDKEESFNRDYKELTAKKTAEFFWKGLDSLDVRELYAVVGGSLGGGIAWEMAFLRLNSIKNLVPIASGPAASDWLIGNVLVQDRILNNSTNPIEDARLHAMLLYRTPFSLREKFNFKFNREENQYAVESWLKYHGETLNKRFSLRSYLQMNHLLKTIGENLRRRDIIYFAKNSSTRIFMIGIDTDYLFTADEQQEVFDLIRKYKTNISFSKIRSIHGHDAFLIEYEQLNKLLKKIF